MLVISICYKLCNPRIIRIHIQIAFPYIVPVSLITVQLKLISILLNPKCPVKCHYCVFVFSCVLPSEALTTVSNLF